MTNTYQMKNQIRKFTISNFKAFGEGFEVPFKDLTVLAGGNSVGKSTIVQALLLSRIAMENADEDLVTPVPLNEEYLLNLGKARQITNSQYITFKFGFEQESVDLVFGVPIDKNYLNLQVEGKKIPNNILKDNVLHYLNAERIGPRPLHEDSVLKNPITGYQGEYTVQLLVEGLSFDTDKQRNFHKITENTDQSSDNLTDQSNLWMNYIIPDINITANRLKEINNSVASINQHTPPNVGFGVSYVLPIIVSGLIAYPGSILIVENPEAHLHPSGQSRIGQFLSVVASAGVQVIIETHSEHVINGIRVASMLNYLDKDKVVINFLSKNEEDNQLIIKNIRLDKFGDLTDYPKGFFDQTEQDLIQLIKLRNQQNETR